MKPIEISYEFRFSDEESKTFSLQFHPSDFRLLSPPPDSPPTWTELGYFRCCNCPLSPQKHSHCPPAVHLWPVIEFFRKFASYTKALVRVHTPFRLYEKHTTLQEGMSSLIGLYMACSGCPILDRLRPLAYIHLPFASLGETRFRAAAMYTLAQYFLSRRGEKVDWNLTGLRKVYEDIQTVNRDFAKRLLQICEQDASLNALVRLDCFAINIATMAESSWEKLEPLFSAYWRNVESDSS